jgi:S-adenosylmethionine hydrolase
MATRQLIYFFTDFGADGPYLGQMETAVLELAPMARVINLLADAPVSNPHASAYLLAALLAELPDNAILVCVIDPGVGSERNALMLCTGGRTLIGPDNGLLAVSASMDPDARAYKIPHDKSRMSVSFHGRDLFAPVAARIWSGEDIPLESVHTCSMVGSDWSRALEEVVYIDHYGNAMTGILADYLTDEAKIKSGAHVLHHAPVFSAADETNPFWYRNSCGLIELAVNRGRADQRLDLVVGSQLSIVHHRGAENTKN